MKVSREQVAENRRMILDAAGRLFRERGFEAVTVAEIMQAAGLTHGGFYGYFTSKDDLIAQALAEALANSSIRADDLAGYAASYLSPGHRDDRACGCATAALAADTIRQKDSARSVMTQALEQQIERLSRIASGRTAAQKRNAAVVNWSTMVGALILARASDDPVLSDEILADTRAWLAAQSGKQDKAPAPRKGRKKTTSAR
ncbi:helix-turn-helix domain-containing protein [Methylocella sp. CPCC 101449]|uniref:TetR/AcrR family transcriptional regulator n=1 Tax=Methylocella sp. CPCC 101449 TaxID=2987531 RepID=UPI00288E57A7|nr:helix-turn-helix domain-containing protein [Methylocella sp. CPCC 101449]MDT2022282.1 TetR/AcrR family transcriptional regulator [Methylocella sp. CPCC 101449]